MYGKDVLKEYIFDCQIRKLSKRTIKTYRINISLFLDFLKEEYDIEDIEEMRHQHIKQYFKFLMNKDLSESYINSILKSLKSYFRYAISEDYVMKNICDKVPWQREKKVMIQTFSDDEVINMMKVYGHSSYLEVRNATILAFLFDTGIRNNELCCITNKGIKEMDILIQGKGNKERYVAISPYLKKYMIKYERIKEFYFKYKNIKYDNYFLSRTGRPLTIEAVERVVKLAGEKAGIRKEIRCSPHTCRHYYAQKSLQNGLDVYSLSRILGHEDISITKRYLQSMQDREIIRMSVKTSPLMNIK